MPGAFQPQLAVTRPTTKPHLQPLALLLTPELLEQLLPRQLLLPDVLPQPPLVVRQLRLLRRKRLPLQAAAGAGCTRGACTCLPPVCYLDMLHWTCSILSRHDPA
jgi:hypothetical protein